MQPIAEASNGEATMHSNNDGNGNDQTDNFLIDEATAGTAELTTIEAKEKSSDGENNNREEIPV